MTTEKPTQTTETHPELPEIEELLDGWQPLCTPYDRKWIQEEDERRRKPPAQAK